MPPLNTPRGMAWLRREIKSVDPDAIVFDSIMCLLEGTMSEEESWAPIKAEIRKISGWRIAQIWLHHTGHDNSKGFGTKTREWEMDTVIALTSSGDDDGSILMEFKKARLRKPETRDQFESKKLLCGRDGWEIVGEAPKQKKGKGDAKKESLAEIVRREFRAAYEHLANDVDPTPGLDGCSMVRKVKVEAIRDLLKKRGKLDTEDDGGMISSKGRTAFKEARLSLTATGKNEFIQDGDLIWALCRDRPGFTFKRTDNVDCS